LLRRRFPTMLRTEVPYGSEFEKITLRRAPVESYAPASQAAQVYRELWREIDDRLEASGIDREAAPAPPGHSAQEPSRVVS
jgi:nitrogenase subunit NifH